jgi:hypothetical protein
VKELVDYNPMNLKDVNELIGLPLRVIENFCDISKKNLHKIFKISYDELIDIARTRIN